MRFSHLKHAVVAFLLGAFLVVAACASPVRPAPERPRPVVEDNSSLQASDDAHGMQLFISQQCVTCHGAQAQGGIGPSLASTDLTFEVFLSKVRNAIPPKPAYSAEVLSAQDVFDIYGWLLTISPQLVSQPRPPLEIIEVLPGQEELPEGPILGMSLWTGFECDSCHGAFAQGSSDGPQLAELTFPYEVERAKMRQTAGEIPEHDQTFMRDTVLKRLYKWLQSGANPEGGC